MESTALLAKERTIAGPGFNRWLVPPASSRACPSGFQNTEKP